MKAIIVGLLLGIAGGLFLVPVYLPAAHRLQKEVQSVEKTRYIILEEKINKTLL